VSDIDVFKKFKDDKYELVGINDDGIREVDAENNYFIEFMSSSEMETNFFPCCPKNKDGMGCVRVNGHSGRW
jgi:hypothetical protein